MKKILVTLLTLVVSVSFVACGETGTKEFNKSKEITVISREDGSGTRGAFIELLEIQEKDAKGNKVDKTSKDALIVDKTDVMLSQVSGNEYAIGYISAGSLSDKIKALKIDGVEPTSETIKNGSYKISRSFYVATKAQQSEVTKDFISYILSKEGQAIISKSYISVNDSAAAYAGNMAKGKIVIAGSSSVTPIMEKLKEAYVKINANANIEIQQSDSSSGMKAAMDGICDIGMSSRDLKDTEKSKLTPTAIAIDGIAIIINKNNTISDISSETAKKVFIGEVTKWSDIK